MSLGTGIFLSTLIVSIVLLFRSTKDRWHWKRIVAWSLAVLVGLPLLTGGAVWGYWQWEEHERNRPKQQSDLWGIKIGSSRDDVLFLKGDPADKAADGNRYWSYRTENAGYSTQYRVMFKTDVVDMVGAASSDPTFAVNGVRVGDNYDTVIKRLGVPDKVTPSDDKLSRILTYKKYHMAIGLARDAVEYFAVYDGIGNVGFGGSTE